ncbi:hypothetical protein FSP39_005367 [Pinctada imbricata]|uniref:Mammalian ependymin-related protein 1 n=1 Tax=Pinctada imbricata TaxID=66713 RepID=A0AA88YHQ2_PINIB|nr:hypothetical protein FSP39_005367 [Pinctada imbricata]
MYTLLCLLGLSVVVLGQIPRACDSPPQWESREIRIDREQNFEIRRLLTYDATNRRERRLEEIEIGSNRTFVDEVILWNENVQYTLDLKTRKCNKTVPYRPWRERGVPPGSRFDFEVVVGAAGVENEHVNILYFSWNSTDGDRNLGMVTSPNCVPIQNYHLSQKYGLEESTYYDVTVGIKDPMNFIPPEECANL